METARSPIRIRAERFMETLLVQSVMECKDIFQGDERGVNGFSRRFRQSPALA
jgi:hypothetical protein